VVERNMGEILDFLVNAVAAGELVTELGEFVLVEGIW
jgi:hypothetical protein